MDQPKRPAVEEERAGDGHDAPDSQDSVAKKARSFVDPARKDDPIAAGLRRLWRAVELEPVPDDFLSILDRADTARKGNEPG